MEEVVDQIERRRWDLISSRWRNYLPDQLDEMPDGFQPPVDDELLASRMAEAGPGIQFNPIEDAPKIRTLIFEAARFCVERGLYFTRGAEQLVVDGMPTAAITMSYIGTVFSSRAIQNLLGIYYCFHQNSTWLLDVWPGASAVTSQGRPKEWLPSIFGVVYGTRIGHQQHWKLFIRLRSNTTRLPIDQNAMSVLRRLRQHGSFSSHRNDIQYNDHWPYPDLHRQLIDAELGLLPEGFSVSETDLDHTIMVAQVMALCSARMLLDVLSPLRKFSEYCSELKSRLSREWHPLMNAGALSSAVPAQP